VHKRTNGFVVFLNYFIDDDEEEEATQHNTQNKPNESNNSYPSYNQYLKSIIMSSLKLNSSLLLSKLLAVVFGPIAAAASVYLLATTFALGCGTAIALSGGVIALNTLREDDNTLEKNAVLCCKSAMALYTIKWIGVFKSFCLLLWTTSKLLRDERNCTVESSSVVLLMFLAYHAVHDVYVYILKPILEPILKPIIAYIATAIYHKVIDFYAEEKQTAHGRNNNYDDALALRDKAALEASYAEGIKDAIAQSLL
jgi:hypothetical protein